MIRSLEHTAFHRRYCQGGNTLEHHCTMRNTLVLTIIIVGFGSEGQGSALLGKDSDSVMNGNSKFLECGEQMGMRSVPTS